MQADTPVVYRQLNHSHPPLPSTFVQGGTITLRYNREVYTDPRVTGDIAERPEPLHPLRSWPLVTKQWFRPLLRLRGALLFDYETVWNLPESYLQTTVVGRPRVAKRLVDVELFISTCLENHINQYVKPDNQSINT